MSLCEFVTESVNNSLYVPVAVKYDYVGKLLKPGEEPTEYTDDEEGKDKKTD